MTTYRLASRDDDAALRALLSENEMPSWVEMVIARDPSYFDGVGWYGDEVAVLAQAQNEVLGMYGLRLCDLYLGGQIQRFGYLGGLRVRQSQRHRIGLLRGGYRSIRRLAPQPAPVCWFTVIAEGNAVARRMLEAGVPGLPKYQHIANLVTYAIAHSRARTQVRWRVATEKDIGQLLAFHQTTAKGCDLAPVLTQEVVHQIGVANFWMLERSAVCLGMACLWDQRAFKQIVARSYAGWVKALRPAYNAIAHLTRRPLLPGVGEPLEQSFVAFLALSDEVLADAGFAKSALTGLIGESVTPVIALGLNQAHPLNRVLASFGGLQYRTRLYEVIFDNASPILGQGLYQPEVALL